MKETMIKGLNSFTVLFDFENYTVKEQIFKIVLMPFALVINAVLFIIISFFLLIEKVFSYGFRLFIRIQTKLFHKKMQVTLNQKKWFTLLSVLTFIVFSPCLLVYLLAILGKKLGKHFMKSLLHGMDFPDNLKDTELLVFDDQAFADMSMNHQFEGLFKDLRSNDALGEALEDYVNKVREDDDSIQ